jgi:NitT/TauT family transport system substrate-binding protein
MTLRFLKKNIVITGLVIILTSTIIAGRSHGKDLIRFGLLPVVDTLPLLVAQESGLFQQHDIELEVISFQSALERDAALQAGRLDGYFGDILNTILLIHAGQEIKIITTAFHTHPKYRMFGIVASPSSKITKMDQLKGKEVAISRATIIEYLLDTFLLSQNLPNDFVVKQEIKKIPIRLQMLLSNQVPAAILPEPLLTLAEAKGARIILDDRRLDTSVTVLALNSDLSEKDPTLVPRFLAAYNAAVEKINQNPVAFKETLITRTRFPEPVKDTYRIPRFPVPSPPAESDIAAAQNWIIKSGMAKKELPYNNIVYSAP